MAANPHIIKQQNPKTTIYLFYVVENHYQSLIRDPSIRGTKDIATFIEVAAVDTFISPSPTNAHSSP